MKKLNILLTSVRNHAFMIQYFRDALEKRGKVFAGNSKMTAAMLQADTYTITPLIYSDSYSDFLLNYCLENQITAILTWYDIDLLVLAKNKERFKEHGITVVVSDEPILQIYSDKWKTCQFLSSIGLKQPKSYINLDLLKQDIRMGKITFPIFIKPRWGVGSYGIYQANTLEELDVLYQKSHRDIFNSIFKYESAAEENTCVIMQEKVEGVEHGLDVLNDLNGNYVTTIAKHKFAMREGSTDMAQIVDNKLFENTAKLISSNLKHIGNLDIDCFLTTSGEVIIVDTNCRFGGHYTFSHLAGADFPKQIVEWLMGNPTSKDNITVNVGIKGVKELEFPVRIE